MITYSKALLPSLRMFCSIKNTEHPAYETNPELRDRLNVPDLEDYHKQFLYQHITNRQTFSLYNFMSKLPISVAEKIGRLAGATKAIVQSDNLYLPRFTPNGVPIYDSINNGGVVRLVKSSEIAWPILFVTLAQHPYIAIVTAACAYLGFYRNSFTKLGNTFVTKMELIPETQEIIYQKIGSFGIIRTNRISIDDLEYFDRSQLNDLIFYRSTRNFIDKDLMFRVKSTGELLTFDREGLWYEEGINHELMI